MNETQCNDYGQDSPLPGIRVSGLILMLVVAVACLLVMPIALAQTDTSSPKPSLVYIADSENQRLNTRLRELLAAGFDDSVLIRSFVSGQTSQDGETPVIAIGPSAFNRVREENKQLPVLGLLIDEAYLYEGSESPSRRVSGVLSAPLLLRQVALGKSILPFSTRVAMLARPETEHLYDNVRENLHHLGLDGRVFLVPSDDSLIPTLIRALNYGDFVLAAPDATIYNPRTIKHILLTAYRRNRIVIGPSQAYVKAGSLASSYTPLSDLARTAAQYIEQYLETKQFPEPAYPSDFGIEINRQVGRSLNIPLLERQTLIDAVIQRLESVETSTNE